MRFSSGGRLGPYEIVGPLGEGGMGEVYRAVDTRLSRQVAIKILSERMTESRRAKSRFEREARAVAALSHPNILSIFEFDVEGATPFVVSELLEGETLRQRMAGRIPWKKAAEWGAAIADGLAAAHAHGVTHRDLKPENVFLTRDGRVKILDFGIAHMKEGGDGAPSDTAPTAEFRADAPIGTIGYISPEQLRQKEPAPTSDLFSLGVILYELLGGTNPFARATAMETVASILGDEPRPLREIAPDVPASFVRLVERCLEKNPETRIQSARDLAFDLRELLREAEGERRSPERRRRISAGAAAAIALASLAVFLVLTETRVAQIVGTTDPPIASVAILPLVNGAGDENLDYLADGITEELINHLSAVGALRVVARSVAFQYKGSPRNPIEIARELGVDAVVTGRLDIRDDTVALQLELSETESRAQLWGEAIERKLDDVPTIPGELARKIAKSLRWTLSRSQGERIARAATRSGLAYDLYMRGMDALNTIGGLEGREQAIRHFRQAIEVDPQFALAHAALGQTYVLFSVNTDPHLMRENAREPIARAIELEPELAEARLALALLRYFDWDFDGAEAEFKRAIRLGRHLAPARAYYANLLMYRGQFEDAIREARQGREIDPTDPASRNVLIVALIHAGRLDEAAAEARRFVKVAPDSPRSHYLQARVFDAQGEDAAACEEFVTSRRLAGTSAAEIATLQAACASGGLEAYRRALIPILQRGELSVEAFEIAATYAALGQTENAIHYLEIVFEEHSNGLFAVGIEPAFESVRNDPRVRALLDRAGLLGVIAMRPPSSSRDAAPRAGGGAPTAPRAPTGG